MALFGAHYKEDLLVFDEDYATPRLLAKWAKEAEKLHDTQKKKRRIQRKAKKKS